MNDNVKRYMTAERAVKIKRRMVEENVSLFRVYADYRPALQNQYPYYVFGKNATKAKREFATAFPWLRVFKLELCSPDEVNYTLENYEKVILL